LKRWTQDNDSTIYLFEENGRKVSPDYISAIFRKLANKAGVNATFHSLRNTRIYEMIANGKSAEEIMKFAGFKSIASLARFCVLKEGRRELLQKLFNSISTAQTQAKNR